MQLPDFQGTPAPFMRVPEFKGEPLSVMSRMTQADAPEHLWHYTLKLTPQATNLDTINRLTEQGYEPVEDEKGGRQKGELTALLFSQLHDLVATHDGERITIWAHHKSIEFVKKYPVLLSFTLKGENHPESDHIQMLQLLPLPRYGEYAVIMDHEPRKATIYTPYDLGEDGQKVKRALGETILSLAGDYLPGESQWMTFAQPHVYCANELQYLAMRADLQTSLLDKRKAARQEAKSALEKLEKAHHEVVNLRQSWLRPDWLHQWKEICRMAQELAANYYDHHKKKPNQETTPFLFTPPLPPEKRKRRRPTVISQFDSKGYAEIAGPLPMQAVINGVNNAVSGADKWIFDERTGLPPHFPYEKESGTTIVSYSDQIDSPIYDAQAAQRLWTELKGFDERTNDIILDIFSHLSRNLDEEGGAWFFASKHLDNRGLEPITKAEKPGAKRRRAGHRKEDILPINSVLNHLEKIWLTISQHIEEEGVSKRGKKQRRRTLYTHRGRFLVVDQKWYQNEITEEESNIPFPMGGYAIGWHIRPGEWLRTFLESPNRQVARLCQTLLQYDHYHQKWEKRIGRYMMFHGHMQCRGGGGTLTRNIGKILDEVSLTPDKTNPIRTRDRFEQALNQLTQDHIIDGWQYEKKDLSLPRKQWLDPWLKESIMIEIAPTKQLLTNSDNSEQD